MEVVYTVTATVAFIVLERRGEGRGGEGRRYTNSLVK
jgi:hypothetical protein